MEYELKGCVSGSHRPGTSTQSYEKSWESAKAVVPFCSWKAGDKLNSLEKIDRAYWLDSPQNWRCLIYHEKYVCQD